MPSVGRLWPSDDDDDDGRDELFIVVVEQAASAFRFFLLFSSGLRVGQENKFYFGNTIRRNLHFKVKFWEKRAVTSEVLIAK